MIDGTATVLYLLCNIQDTCFLSGVTTEDYVLPHIDLCDSKSRVRYISDA